MMSLWPTIRNAGWFSKNSPLPVPSRLNGRHPPKLRHRRALAADALADSGSGPSEEPHHTRLTGNSVRVYWPSTRDMQPGLGILPRRGLGAVPVDYRLGTEHKFPVAVEDAYAAARYVATHAGEFGAAPYRIAVGGDSAGGNLAAAVTPMGRDRGGPRLSFQLLVYRGTDSECDRPSMRESAHDHLLTRAAAGWFWGHYLDDGHGRNPIRLGIEGRTACVKPGCPWS